MGRSRIYYNLSSGKLGLMKPMGQYRLKKERKQSRFFLLLSIIFIGVMIKWGVPAMINVMAGSPVREDVQDQEKDILPPQKPVLSAIPSAINQAELTVSGYTEAAAQTELWLDEEFKSNVQANDQGAFSFKVSLAKGEHKIFIKAKDSAGNESQSETKTIVYDPEKISLQITDPQNGTEIFGKENKSLNVKGKVNKTDAEVKVNNNFTETDSEGNFEKAVSLSEGENQIKIEAVDKAGNTTLETITVKFYP